MVHSPSGVHQPDTYVCWDYYSSLNPFGFCQWRGLFRQGPKTYSIFNDEIQEMKNQGVNLKGLKWSNDLSKAAANYLKDLEGCRSIPDQIFHDKESSYYIDQLHLEYDNHLRVVLMPMRNPWMNALEAVFDLLVDDYYDGHPNRQALLSNDYDSIGVACNCHARFGQVCVFELTSTTRHSGAALSLYGPEKWESCED